MKKLILLAVFAATSSIAISQVSFGIHVGPNFGMGKYKYNEAAFDGYTTHSQKNKMKIGFVGGFVAEIPIGSMLAFRPELNYVQEGTKENANATDIAGAYTLEQKISLNYIQIPLNVIYKLPVGGGSVFFGLGPELEIGLSGKNKYRSTSTFSTPFEKTYDVKFDGKKSDDITDPNDDDNHLKRFDAGINVLAGYKLAMGVFVKLAYTHGFIDIDPNKGNANAEDKSSYKNSSFNLTFGYMLGGSKSKK